jgi:hypothetical protein
MPRLGHLHKSMLLRGVKFPARALDNTDIEVTKGRAAHSGRNHGGVPLRGGYGSGRERDSFNYAASNAYAKQPFQGQQSYSTWNSYKSPQYPYPQMPNWHSAPSGVAGFAQGPPLPPQVAYPLYGSRPHEVYPNSSSHSQYQNDKSQHPSSNGKYDRRSNGKDSHMYNRYSRH